MTGKRVVSVLQHQSDAALREVLSTFNSNDKHFLGQPSEIPFGSCQESECRVPLRISHKL